MRVIVYLEGPSDKLALSALLEPLLTKKQNEGVSIEFFETPDGDRKVSLLTKVPIKAVNILLNDPTSIVVAIPDLYPKNKGFPHESYTELVEGLLTQFENAICKKIGAPDQRYSNRFKVFCFKHDLEALLLASEESLRAHFGRDFKRTWHIPVEDQNHNHPPKYVIEDLYHQYGQKYRDTVDAPLILRSMAYSVIAERCPQCFNPLVEFLENLQDE